MPKQKYTLEDAVKLAKKRNGRCLSTNYKNTRQPMKWLCLRCDHIWNSNFYNIKNGSWCRKCAQNKQKYTIKMCKDIAIKHSGKCLDEKYINSKNPMKWQCDRGHIWYAQFCMIKAGQWCKRCCKRLSIDVAHVIAKKHNGKCLSKSYNLIGEKLKWECINKHVWYASLNNVKNNGSWCPRCKNKTQEILLKILQKLFPNCEIKNNFRDFDWLRTNKYGKQEIDIFIFNNKSFSLGVEYDGEHHFMPIRFGGISKNRAKINLKRQKYLDRLKNSKISKHKTDVKYFIRFSYKDKINFNNVKKRLIDSKIL